MKEGKREKGKSGLLNLLVPSRGDKDEWERRKERKNTGPRIPTIDVGSSLARSGRAGMWIGSGWKRYRIHFCIGNPYWDSRATDSGRSRATKVPIRNSLH